MTPFFADPARQAALQAELVSWRGTPFTRSGLAGAKKGLRANCVTFAEAVPVNLGVFPAIQWPPYVVSGGGEAMLKLILAGLEGIPNVRAIWRRPEPMPDHTALLPGDIILVSSGRALHHLAIYAGDKTVWHSLERGGGVCTGNVYDPLLQRHGHSIWRAYEPR